MLLDTRKPCVVSPRDLLLITAAVTAVIVLVYLVTRFDFIPYADEHAFSFPAIEEYSRRLPSLRDLRETTLPYPPLFHATMGRIGRVIGVEYPRLRAVVTIVGLAAVLSFYIACSASLGRPAPTLTPLLLFSFPYCFFCSFLLYTDVPPLVPALLAVALYASAYRTGSTSKLIGAAVLSGIAIWLRQVYAFVPVGFFVHAMLFVPEPKRRRKLSLIPACGVLFVVPLVLLWMGPMPPRAFGTNTFEPHRGAARPAAPNESEYEAPNRGGPPLAYDHVGLPYAAPNASWHFVWIGFYFAPLLLGNRPNAKHARAAVLTALVLWLVLIVADPPVKPSGPTQAALDLMGRRFGSVVYHVAFITMLALGLMLLFQIPGLLRDESLRGHVSLHATMLVLALVVTSSHAGQQERYLLPTVPFVLAIFASRGGVHLPVLLCWQALLCLRLAAAYLMDGV